MTRTHTVAVVIAVIVLVVVIASLLRSDRGPAGHVGRMPSAGSVQIERKSNVQVDKHGADASANASDEVVARPDDSDTSGH